MQHPHLFELYKVETKARRKRGNKHFIHVQGLDDLHTLLGSRVWRREAHPAILAQHKAPGQPSFSAKPLPRPGARLTSRATPDPALPTGGQWPVTSHTSISLWAAVKSSRADGANLHSCTESSWPAKSCMAPDAQSTSLSTRSAGGQHRVGWGR